MASDTSIMNILFNFIAILISLLIYFDFGFFKGVYRGRDRYLFKMMILITVTILISDSLGYYCDGKTSNAFIFLNYSANIVYSVCNPFISYIWILYCMEKLNYTAKSYKHLKALVTFLSSLILILNIFGFYNNSFFFIDSANKYIRGPLYIEYSLVNISLLLLSYILILMKLIHPKNKLRKRNAIVLLSYAFFPLLGAYLQSIAYGINTIWVFSSISLLIIYVNIQNSRINTDFLTGLNNRQRFEFYTSNKIKNISKNKTIFLLMLDLDGFKKINDMHGHLVGDEALISFSNILSSSVSEHDFIARMGGDEFIIVGERSSKEKVDILKNKIGEEIKKFNENSEASYTLATSIGMAYFDGSKEIKLHELLSIADKDMYKAKKAMSNAHKPLYV